MNTAAPATNNVPRLRCSRCGNDQLHEGVTSGVAGSDLDYVEAVCDKCNDFDCYHGAAAVNAFWAMIGKAPPRKPSVAAVQTATQPETVATNVTASSGTGLFARVQILPTCWIVRAERLRTYELGTTYAVFEICFQQARATVFVLEKAIEIRDNISRLFPAVHLEPATFEQWVEQETE